MMQIRNRHKGPTQLVVRSFSERREHARAFTTLNIPGNTTITLPDERIVTEYLERSKKWGLLSTKYIPDNEVQKEEK